MALERDESMAKYDDDIIDRTRKALLSEVLAGEDDDANVGALSLMLTEQAARACSDDDDE